MAGDREQDVGRTATEAASAAMGEAAGAPRPLGATLGRYRLERELGAGAMGVVHAAFDPDLERRIALKVLREATATVEARDRLLREARAMARLTHPNVVTVYEVGTASGRDFVAMELVHGETLAAWLRASPRTPAVVIDAFLAAGRGLAAAHAAGIVHRDFKPHNVLRSRAGRIVVTDFGLAREAQGALPAALETTLPGSTAPTALAGLTVTGSLLGTPAYMAPEQWQGGAVTPATDQFAYCIALWEAFAGGRPYRGPTFDELRSQVARGPAALDASRIPRRVRGLLRRGLDPDPARRWPSMDALLAQLARAQRRPGVARAIGGGALIAAGALVFALRPDAPPACEPPARDVATVWSPAIAAELGAKTSAAHATVLAAAYHDWERARAAACTAPPQVRQAQLSCLDGVLARFDALRQASLRVPEGPTEDLQATLVDPAVCRKPVAADIPRLMLAPTPGAIAALAMLGRSQTEHKPSEAEIAALAGAATPDPCARVIAALAFDTAFQGVAAARAVLAEAAAAADQCGDERLRADLMIQGNPYHWELPMVGPKADAAIQQARIAATRVLQSELEAALASLSRRVARRRGQWDEAFRLAEIELAGYRAHGLQIRQLRAVLGRNALRLARAEPGDLAAIAGDVQIWRPIAVAHHRLDLARQLDIHDARARFQLGDVASAHADLVRLWLAEPLPAKTLASRKITGEVVDADGRPVAGATVAAASVLYADAAGVGSPMFRDYIEDDLRIVTSDGAGQFAIDDGARVGAIAAQLADRRSKPAAIADRVKLVLEPTRRVTGKVNLGRTPYTRVDVYGVVAGDPSGNYALVSPVGADGSFAMAGVTLGAFRIGASIRDDTELDDHIDYRDVPASAAPVTGLTLEPTSSTRVLDVIVRNAVAAPLDGALVVLLPGKHEISRMEDLNRRAIKGSLTHFARPVAGDSAPGAVLGKLHPGDLLAHIEHAGAGELTVCALNFAGDWMDPEFRQRAVAHFSQIAFKCTQIGPDAAIVELLVPPQQRFE
jgi:predicted Ser/Thr protein kinase